MFNMQIQETSDAQYLLTANGNLDDDSGHELEMVISLLAQKAAAITVDLHTVRTVSAQSIDALSMLRRRGVGLSRVPAFIADWLDAEKWVSGKMPLAA